MKKFMYAIISLLVSVHSLTALSQSPYECDESVHSAISDMYNEDLDELWRDDDPSNDPMDIDDIIFELVDHGSPWELDEQCYDECDLFDSCLTNNY